jgi:hypothetical protein
MIHRIPAELVADWLAWLKSAGGVLLRVTISGNEAILIPYSFHCVVWRPPELTLARASCSESFVIAP